MGVQGIRIHVTQFKNYFFLYFFVMYVFCLRHYTERYQCNIQHIRDRNTEYSGA
jgi:hypothetical protein